MTRKRRFSLLACWLGVLMIALVPCAVRAEKNTYVSAGVPSPGKPWTGADYQQAATVLGKEGVPLPQLTDPEGAVLFGRIVAEENLDVFQDKAVSLQSKFPAYLQVQENANAILKLYLSAFNEGRIKSSTELTRLMVFMLHIGSIGSALITEFIPTIPHDEKYEIRMAGLQKMKSGMTKMFAGLERSLGEKKVYSPADLSALLAAMKRELPVYRPMFEEGYADKLAEQLRLHMSEFSSALDKATLQAMITELSTPPAQASKT